MSNPINDNFVDSIELSGASVSTTGTNVGATGEINEPSQSGNTDSVWWSWTAPSSGLFAIDTNGSNYDTYLSVFTGNAVNSLTTIAQNDDGGIGLQSEVLLNAIAGETYHIAVDGWSSSEGLIDLNINAVQQPVNDNFADRIRVTGASVAVEGTNEYATGETGEPGQSGELNSSWWTWRAPADGVVTIDTNGSNYDTYLSAFTGNAVDGLTTVSQNDDGGIGLQSQVSFAVEAGQTYQIAVDGFSSSQGAIDLNINLPLNYTQVGTSASEQLNGTGANDVIAGLGGNDQINGNGGHDYLEGNGGNDTIAGGSLSDYIDGGAGNDLLYGNGGGDEIFGRGGNDGLYGSSATDYLNGGNGDDTLYGNGGEDELLGGGGADLIYGGSDADYILGGGGDDTIYANGANSGADYIDSGAGNDTIWLGHGDAEVVLSQGVGFDVINNFQLGQTSLIVSDVNALSFADGANGAQIYQGSDLLATVSWQSASTFADNMNDIFVAA